MSLRFFNTYSRAVEEFSPRDPATRQVTIYTCGPTVYSRAHIGNFRAYIFEDLLVRYLEAREYDIARVMNLTDVDDKTIRGAREAGVRLSDFTAQFKKAFFEDCRTLRLKPAGQYPSATDQRYIEKMIAMISALMAKGLAYQAEDQSVYYRIHQFPRYGCLAHFDLSELRSTGRVKNDEYEKENIGDFALWKAWDEADGAVQWQSPWGPGRPGWHIECSAMATDLLGEQIDIHCGGVDNIFPHHEAEIAQTEGVTGKQFVRYWLHCEHLLVDGQKMSKSLGNFYTLRDVLDKGYSGREARYALLRVNYRKPLNFTWGGMEEARESLGRIDDWLSRLNDKSQEQSAERSSFNIEPPIHGFEEQLDDDLNISGALGVLFDGIRESNRALDEGRLDSAAADKWLQWWARIDRTLDLTEARSGIPSEIVGLAEQRIEARLAKEWQRSDELRAQLAVLGWEVRDTKEGQKLTKRAGG